jgi:hypothetical protein
MTLNGHRQKPQLTSCEFTAADSRPTRNSVKIIRELLSTKRVLGDVDDEFDVPVMLGEVARVV